MSSFYTTIPTCLINQCDVSSGAFRLYLTIAANLDEYGRCTMTNVQIAEILNENIRSTQRKLKELTEQGYVITKPIVASGVQVGREIWIDFNFTAGLRQKCHPGMSNLSPRDDKNVTPLYYTEDIYKSSKIDSKSNTDKANHNIRNLTTHTLHLTTDNNNLTTNDEDAPFGAVSVQPSEVHDLEENAQITSIVEIAKYIKEALNAFYHRKPTTTWSSKENTQLTSIAHRTDAIAECDAILSFYRSGYQYKRRDIYTLLNNWCTEYDRAMNRNMNDVSQTRTYDGF